MRTWLPALALATVIAAPAHADDGYGGPYPGTGNHVKLGTGFGFFMGVEGGSATSITPTIEGRFKLGESFGLQVVLPFSGIFASVDSGDSDSRFDIGNPSVAFEAVLEETGFNATIVRGGLTLPLLSAADNMQDLGEQVANVLGAWGTHGWFNMWRYSPENLTIFGEIVGTIHNDIFMEFAGGFGMLIPTSDGGDTQFVLQGSAKIGGGSATIVGYGGLGFVVLVSELGEDGDAAQINFQGGIIAQLGRVRLDAALLFNLDDPFGFSLDEGVLGANIAVSIPF